MSALTTEKQKMLAGALYDANDPELVSERAAAARWMVRYNASLAASTSDRLVLLHAQLGNVGEGAEIRPPFHCDYGSNIIVGRGVFLNFNCVVLDVVGVTIGAGTQIGPAVQIYTADHPRDPVARRAGKEFGQPIRIGRNVWIGGSAVILPGVTIGDDAIIGAGSVVTHDIAAGVTVFGNPARAKR
ncbi:MAG: maltose O-acetyltransferase [Acetobacteraceae bacterium]|nr:maltose O-acetyltransferase [Acetobacteraceae bacterium]